MLPSLIYNPPPHTSLDILYQDEHLVVLNKPSGLLSVPGRGEDKQDCMLSRLQLEYTGALAVHRLDMPTSGILIFALNKESHRELSKLFQQRKIVKQYIAKVQGKLEYNTGIIEQPLITDWPNRPKQKIDYKSGKASTTRYKLLSHTEDNSSIVQLQPVTGRSHQLRVHMSSLGHPILGDELYGTAESRNASSRLLLHSEAITFTHPVTHNIISLNSQADFL